MELVPKIGLEIHAELKTRTKMFCGSLNEPDEKHPNSNVCPVCMGHPGVLPVINKQAVKNVLRVGLALNGKLADFCRFDRKNYFYPDLPKGYQISQYEYPLVSGGALKGVLVKRIHLEEDAGKLVHGKDATFVDLNRAGVPLMELVTEPCVFSAKEARDFAVELQLVLRYLDVSNADMEKGQMRIEANISVASKDSEKFGTKVEVKNLNSFRAVYDAIEYETERQKKVLNDGGTVIHETRGWDDAKQRTFSQRHKEEANDYRYFPEPDLPPLFIDAVEEFKDLKITIPELPWEKRERLIKEYEIKKETADVLAAEIRMADFFEKTISEAKADLSDDLFRRVTEITINYLLSDLTGLMKEKYLGFGDLLLTPENLADLMVMVASNKISSRVAKDVLRKMVETGGDPAIIVKDAGLEQVSGGDFIETAAKKVITENPKAVEDYKKGKNASMQYLVGMLMKETKGKSNPQKAAEIIEKFLNQG